MLNTELVTPKKICDRPGCTVELSDRNASGRCRGHVRWQNRTQSAGNGHASAGSNGSHAAANGSAKKTNGSNGHAAAPANGNGAAAVLPDLAGNFLEERLDLLLSGFTVAEKAKIVTAWLKGEI